jgi:hypothetical protein
MQPCGGISVQLDWRILALPDVFAIWRSQKGGAAGALERAAASAL